MIKTIEELKDLIIFARANKVKSLKIGELELEVSELAHIDTTPGLEQGQSQNPSVTASIPGLFEGLSDSLDPEDEELLFHSSRP